MPYSYEARLVDRLVKICACNSPADVLVRGSRWDEDRGRMVLVHRWLCQQCYDNLVDDGATLTVMRRQELTAAEWAAYNRGYEQGDWD